MTAKDLTDALVRARNPKSDQPPKCLNCPAPADHAGGMGLCYACHLEVVKDLDQTAARREQLEDHRNALCRQLESIIGEFHWISPYHREVFNAWIKEGRP